MPHEQGYDFKVIVTNKRGRAKRVVTFHEGRGSQEGIFAELRLHYQMDTVPVTTQVGNPIYLLSAMLHSARYPRKPRGISRSVLGDGYEWRLSFCCARDGCRRRCTPPSVRFFNRRVYLGALVVLISALTHGLTTRRWEKFRERFGVSARTLGRWRR